MSGNDRIGICVLVMLASSIAWGGGDVTTKFSNLGGIINTRHNLAQSSITSGVLMDTYRNDYGEVCVYCHTPHGSNENLAAPLWNRTYKSQTYTTYGSSGSTSLTEDVNQPGVSSLTCLSCHDGTVAMDSIVNMPGSGKYSEAQKSAQNDTFLNNEWTNPSGPDATVHMKLTSGECLACHSSDASPIFVGAAAFDVAALGTDLTNDHPIGIALPTSRVGIDFVDPPVKGAKLAFYDGDGDSRADSNELRFYKNGSDYQVECASCHDPHGVRTGGDGSALIPTFLRISNSNSAVCLTCHEK